jgi:CheY-like chemotaxis protein
MSGTIRVESKVGEGSSFIVSFEGVKATDKQLRRDEGADLKQTVFYGKHVLLVDDSDINRRFVKDNLEESGIIVSEAVNGKDGLEKALTVMPDVILLDIMMPVMDGFELMERLKSDKELTNIPVMALTALAMKDDIERIEKSGFDDFLIKPFHMEELHEKIIKLLGGAGLKTIASEGESKNLYQRDEKMYISSVSSALKVIEKEYLSVWVQANELKEFNSIKEFAEGIHKTGKAFDIRFLVDYGDKLIRNCDNYNIEKIDISLSAFPDYLKKMKEISQTKI